MIFFFSSRRVHTICALVTGSSDVFSSDLLRMYLEQGARRFVFEGRECGGHIGPLASFTLWEEMIDVLLEHVKPGEEKDIHVLFAGGVHELGRASRRERVWKSV